MEREFTRLALGEPTLEFSIAVRDFPHPSLSATSIVGRIAPVFLLASLMVNVVLLIQSLVSALQTRSAQRAALSRALQGRRDEGGAAVFGTQVGERQSGLRGAMTSMGLLDSAHWASVLATQVVLAALHAALLTSLALAFGCAGAVGAC